MPATALQQFLLHPGQPIDLPGLCQAWRETVVSLAIRPAPAHARGLAPELAWRLPGRIRGAWGQQLMRAASPEALAGQPCPWSPPCALETLFRPQGNAAKGLELVRPYVLALDLEPGGPGMRLGLSLFGAAGDYAFAAAEALVCALREGAFHLGDAPLRLEVVEREIAERPGPDLALADISLSARLRFVTPVCQRRGDQVGLHPPSLITGLANRLSSLARWHGLELQADWRELKDIAHGLQWELQGQAQVGWQRRSGRQDGREIPMSGLLGDLYLRGDLPALAPLLELGQRCFAGSHTAMGLGRYELAWL